MWGQIAGLVVLAIFFALVVHSVYKAAANVPGATRREPQGVKGDLLVVVTMILALAFYRLAETMNIFSWLDEVSRGQMAMTSLLTMAGPSLVAALMGFLAVQRLVSARTRATPWLAAGLMWCASVVHSALQPTLTGLPLQGGELAVMALMAIVNTAILVKSERVRNTYGL